MQSWWIWLNVLGMLALVGVLYILNKRVTSRFILLAPIVLFVLGSVILYVL
ncbi:hypothetical protein YSY43_01360 [Paenibacillus sp. YSY-4.3]